MRRTLNNLAPAYIMKAKPMFSSKSCEEAAPLLGGWFGDLASSQGFCFWSRQMTKKRSECTPEERARILERERRRFKERYQNDPEFRERQRQRQRALRSDPNFIATEKKYRARQDVRQKRSKASCDYAKRPKVRTKMNERSAEYRKRPDVAERNRIKQREKRGHTSALFAALLVTQHGKCAVCGVVLSEIPTRYVHADHCHDSGAARGILCQTCNTVEGHIKRTGLTAAEFGARLQRYLDNPPAVTAWIAVDLAG